MFWFCRLLFMRLSILEWGHMSAMASQITGNSTIFQANSKDNTPHYGSFLLDSPHKGPVMQRAFLCRDGFMEQRSSFKPMCRVWMLYYGTTSAEVPFICKWSPRILKGRFISLCTVYLVCVIMFVSRPMYVRSNQWNPQFKILLLYHILHT